MKKLLLLFVIFVLPNFVFGQDIAKILDERLKTSPVGSSISVAVIDENGVKFYTTGKTSKQSNAKAVDKDTVYEIGSITKVFTGILLAEAIKRGEVKLDDPISKYLPKNINSPKFNGKEITLLDLSNHGSALPSLPDDFAPKDLTNPYAGYTFEQMYAFIGRVKLDREIGSKFAYSNLAVGLLGQILSDQAKMSYEDLVKARILKPLGMDHSAITFTPWMRSHLAVGHNEAGKQTSNWDLPTFAGAGALRSTPDDMAKFISANLGFTKTKISDSLNAARVMRKTYDTPAMKIGFNWITTKAGDKDIVWHNGGTGGYRTYAGLVEADGKGVFVATNGSDSVDDLGMHLLNESSPLRVPKAPKTAITLSEDVLETYVGEYQLSPAFSIVVSREGNKLFAQATGQQVFDLLAEKEDEFFIEAVDAGVHFTKDESGKITGLVLIQGGSKTPGKKIK